MKQRQKDLRNVIGIGCSLVVTLCGLILMLTSINSVALLDAQYESQLIFNVGVLVSALGVVGQYLSGSLIGE